MTERAVEQMDLFSPRRESGKRVMVFDLETQKGADDVGGWHNTHLMRLSVGVVHDSRDGEYKVFYEESAPELISLLKNADLVVGYNTIRFDYGVLRGYTEEPLEKTLRSFDMLRAIEGTLGFRVGLGNIATATLNAGKSADGLQALRWFKEGKMDLIAEYCLQDVKVTRDVFLYGLDKGHLFYSKKSGEKVKFPVKWDLEKL